LTKIISIGTAVPRHCHQQSDILGFMQHVYATSEDERRKLKFLYHHGGIEQRYSVLPDFSRPAAEWKFFPHSENLEPFPSIEQRMEVYNRYAPQLSVDAIRDCLHDVLPYEDVTHLITVSCTGMSAPGLDLQVMELMDLPKTIFRTSLNFMGCYAAIHALKVADAFCRSTPNANVLIVCTELCTIHFQREATIDNMTSSLLFGDGAAAMLVSSDEKRKGLRIDHFYSQIITKGKRDMAWELSSTGFLMTLSGYIPDLIQEDFRAIVSAALEKGNLRQEDINKWCIHPGGKKVLQAIEKSLALESKDLESSYDVLRNYGNLSSPTILYVLKQMLHHSMSGEKVFGAGFGPGLTVETFTGTFE
jgi:predicted naringenin-chalcone synthase